MSFIWHNRYIRIFCAKNVNTSTKGMRKKLPTIMAQKRRMIFWGWMFLKGWILLIVWMSFIRLKPFIEWVFFVCSVECCFTLNVFLIAFCMLNAFIGWMFLVGWLIWELEFHTFICGCTGFLEYILGLN